MSKAQKMESKTDENQMTSAAAFVEGGIQDSCDDACSICLEEFCDNDPSTVSKKLTMSYVLAIYYLDRSYRFIMLSNMTVKNCLRR
ncbi:hypothetical protein TSUD_340810 [Trifolium subterraneum]|uniref:Uncharacterized protein n=1 Tax=Trifolium subterraneum TaxID=3900 RepID=A0A2Z6LNG9_TRISU|nr:hypothetical protein TSUD_340810 [Trifolium subterraneum]